MNMKTMLKTSVAAAALFAFAAPVSAGVVSNGQSKVGLKIYGKINKVLLWADDGQSSRALVADMDMSGSRFGMAATAPVNEMVTFGAQMEYEFRSNRTGAVTLHTGAGDQGVGDTNFVERVAEVTATHKTLGKLSLGQGPTSADGTTEVDLSGTTAATYSGHMGHLGSVMFRNETTGATIANIGSAFSNMDGLGRNDRIRYDSPNLAGFALATSYISGGMGDVALRYNGQWGRVKASAAAGYYNQSGTSAANEGGYTGSASLLDASGLNFTLSHAKIMRKSGSTNPDADQVFGKIGYMAKIFGAGGTNFSVDYGKVDNLNGRATDGKTYAIAVQQNFKDIGADAYISYRNWSYDAVGVNAEDIRMIMTGLQVQF